MGRTVRETRWAVGYLAIVTTLHGTTRLLDIG
jgi:hypothetical protein